MHRRLHMRDAFPRSADEYAQPVVRLLRRKRADMDKSWGELQQGWDAHFERMVELGLRPRTSDEGAVKLNVGGSNVTVCWHLLAETEGFEDSILGALLEGVWDKERIPRDVNGLIVLDESPACIKHIVHAMLPGRSSSVALGLPERGSRPAVAIDEAPCLIYTAHVMGLPGSVPTHPKYAKMSGGSTILEPLEIAPFCAKIREWVGGSTEQMTLIYRATRDGFNTESFKPACNEDSPHTVSLIRVSSGKGNDDDSVVGGYSSSAFGSAVGRKQTITAETFLFMLKDGSATGNDPSKPIRWIPYPNRVGTPFCMTEHAIDSAWWVAGDDVCTVFDETEGCILFTGRDTFDIEEDSPFLALTNKKVVDIEIYRYSALDPPTTTAPRTTNVVTDAEIRDIDSFGKSIAASLLEERVVLDRAVNELEAAGARVSAAFGALQTVYGPSVAAGEHDTVVELDVRGTRVTTLRSTLQACPGSALATIFNEDRWPHTNKNNRKHRRRVVDCDPICFAKILDVLRMRKRASWSRDLAGGQREEEEDKEEKEEEKEEKEEESTNDGSGAVLVKRADAEAFGAAVNMYFPGCESFIMNLVQLV